MRTWFFAASAASLALVALAAQLAPQLLWLYAVLGPIVLLGVYDALQTKRAVLRNFPVIGHFRYLFEMIRPEINQYFIESNTDGRPFSRELRSVVYQRAKRQRDTVPFGTQRDVYEVGYEWLDHSMTARHVHEVPRVRLGEGRCEHPYDAALLNISAMSFGSLSANAVRALNGGAERGGFFHNTGEGGVSPYHLEPGGDLCWQLGTGYFGCRRPDGTFDPAQFEEKARLPQVKLIEVKLSQGAKPGHGGILPAAKVTPEIAAIRGVPTGQDVLSPPHHSAFSTPRGLLEFVQQLRDLCQKPVGVEPYVGDRAEVLGVCMGMVEAGIVADFVAVDGGEGGTGAAPLEFSNSIGAPLTEGLVFVHNALQGFGVREQVKVIASGRVVTGFQMAQRLAAGADLCGSARGFMFSLGCIQALRCNSNDCPVGVATQQPGLAAGLVVPHKTERVASWQQQTVKAFLETIGAAGLERPDQLRPWHIHRRVSPTETRTYDEIYDYLAPGQLLGADAPPGWRRWLDQASPERFRLAADEAADPAGR